MHYPLKAVLSSLITSAEHLRRVEMIDAIDFTAVGKKANWRSAPDKATRGLLEPLTQP
jgi:hypothetical protein